MKKVFAILTALCMTLTSVAYAADTNRTYQQKVVSENLSDYINDEVFVMYTDGTCEVLTFDGKDSLSDGLEKLEGDARVLIAQPNYTYESTSITSDELIGKQWALYNDGSFYMEEKKNEYPVFDEPFGYEWLPWTWIAPDWFFRGYKGYSSYRADSTENITAVSGIDINIKGAWELYNGGTRPVTVALVDTGIDTSHEDLQGIFWTNSGEIPDNGIDDDGNGYIDDVNGWNFYNNSNVIYNGMEDSHGTHGAGTIAANAENGKGTAGIVQSDLVKIMPVKALGGRSGSGSTSSIIKAICYAEKNGASICNLSLGTSFNDPALYEVMKNSNMLFVVAAGNESADNDKNPCYPASYDLENIISVANIGYDGKLNYSSNYGANSVDIAAPGTYILSTTQDNSYSYMTGTSMSAPMVSGVAAMLYSSDDSITLSNVKEIILSSAKKLDSLNGIVLTGGMLDAGAAMAYDTSKLSGGEWEVKTPVEYKGTAPEMSVFAQNINGKDYLVISVYDEDGDLAKTAYAEGEQSAEYFKTGGTSFETDKNGKAAIEISPGVYTLYAADSCGNENVYPIKIVGRENKNENPPRHTFGGIGEDFWDFPFSSQDPYDIINEVRNIMDNFIKHFWNYNI